MRADAASDHTALSGALVCLCHTPGDAALLRAATPPANPLSPCNTFLSNTVTLAASEGETR